jgi:divalent metal cation (Fe/Co/Zn/Cd) transporter
VKAKLKQAKRTALFSVVTNALLAGVKGTVPGVLGIEKCWARKNGMTYVVDLHLELDGNLSVTEGHAISHALKDHLMQEFPYLTEILIHIEPAPHLN